MNKLLMEKYTNKKILLYTSFTNDEDKMKLDNVNEIWSKCDILIYSPTIEAGIVQPLKQALTLIFHILIKSLVYYHLIQLLNVHFCR
jgi:hypothetical protein